MKNEIVEEAVGEVTTEPRKKTCKRKHLGESDLEEEVKQIVPEVAWPSRKKNHKKRLVGRDFQTENIQILSGPTW